jgi:hypothetical protein
MKKLISILFLSISLQACNQQDKNENPPAAIEERLSFFPVTSYIKGQIREITTYGLAPLQYDLRSSKKDSIWLNAAALDTVFKEFLEPLIDSTNLIETYEESKFADQTIDAFTFTYTPKNETDTTLVIKRWDVYISTKTNKVQRIFIVKRAGKKELQLTWQNDEWCTIRTIGEDTNGELVVEKEVLIKWKYD